MLSGLEEVGVKQQATNGNDETYPPDRLRDDVAYFKSCKKGVCRKNTKRQEGDGVYTVPLHDVMILRFNSQSQKILR